jgi:arylsulfatase A-like enzyme
MKYLLTGIRAGVISALALTLWSFLGVETAMGKTSEATGFYYVLTAFGLLGLPQVVFGAAIGVVIAGWVKFLGADFLERLSTPQLDRKTATHLLSAPVLAVVVGAGVGAVHVAVTASFVRTTFQALGLTLAGIVLAAGACLAAPLVLNSFSALVGRLFPAGTASTTGSDTTASDTTASEPDASSRATMTVLGVYAIGLVGGLVFVYQYAAGLQIWSTELVRIVLGAILLTPILFLAMWRFEVDRLAWRVGIPMAGTLAAAACFVGAFGWSSSSAEMRQATTQHSQLVAKTAKALKPLADRDGDGYADGLGGIDCDDTNADIFPGAQDVPGNDLDEDCSGADAEPPSGNDHASRKIVALAVDAAQSTAAREAENVPDPPKNLVFILVDTLRPDHLGYAGYERETTPNIDKIAAESVAFMDTYAPSPHTPRSIPPLFFSRYPSRMTWRGASWNYPEILEDNLSVFEVLDEQGFYSVGMTSHFYFEPDQGIRQGFDEWDNSGSGSISESNDDIAAPRIWKKTEPVIEAIAKRSEKASLSNNQAEPFALFVHLFEPHARWIGHDEYDFGRGSTPRERHINNYDSEIAYVDAYVGRIVKKLKQEGLYDNSVLVLTSDHGEGFNEHGYFFHGQTLYNEIIHVPLLIRVPGWHSRKVEGPVSLLDVAPTLLGLFGVTIPSEFQGESLVEAMLGRTGVPERPIFAELLPYTSWKEKHQAIIDGDDKLILNVTNGVEELYDLAKDPGEQENIRQDNKARGDELKERLYEFMQGN